MWKQWNKSIQVIIYCIFNDAVSVTNVLTVRHDMFETKQEQYDCSGVPEPPGIWHFTYDHDPPHESCSTFLQQRSHVWRNMILLPSLFGHENVVNLEGQLLPVVGDVAHAMTRVHLKPHSLMSLNFVVLSDSLNVNITSNCRTISERSGCSSASFFFLLSFLLISNCDTIY